MKNNDDALARSAMGGAGKMGVGVVARIVLQLLSIVVLARLLTPDAYGLVAIVMAITAIATVLRDFGLTFASVQAKEMPPELRSNLFWINTAAGTITAILAFAAGWPIAWLFDDERLLTLTWAIAPVYLFNALGAQYQADLTRKMKLGRTVIADVGGTSAGLIAAVVAALSGLDYWSLAINQIGVAIVTFTLLVAYGKWRPSSYNRHVSIRRQMTLGLDIFVSQIINYAARNADTIILGLQLSPAAVGFYDRAYRVYNTAVTQLNQPSTRVALPVLSRLQDNPPEFRRYASRGQISLMHPLMALMSIGVGYGGLLFPFILGPQWSPAALPFQIMCVAGLSQASNYAIYWCYLATGTVRHNVKLMLIWRPITIGFLFIGSVWGVVGVAAAFAVGQIGGWLLQLWWSRRVSIIPRLTLFAAASRGWLLHFPGAASAAYALYVFEPLPGIAVAAGTHLAWVTLVILASRKVRADVVVSARTSYGMIVRLLTRRRSD